MGSNLVKYRPLHLMIEMSMNKPLIYIDCPSCSIVFKISYIETVCKMLKVRPDMQNGSCNSLQVIHVNISYLTIRVSRRVSD
jgi:hypothetical protein